MGDFTDERLAEVDGLARRYEATEAGELGEHLAAVNDYRDATRTDTVLSMCQRIREQAEEIKRLTLENAHLAHISGRG